jgi:hypothetical protein
MSLLPCLSVMNIRTWCRRFMLVPGKQVIVLRYTFPSIGFLANQFIRRISGSFANQIVSIFIGLSVQPCREKGLPSRDKNSFHTTRGLKPPR